MKFKEWFLFNEMPHMALPNAPVNGIVGGTIDFRAEDRRKGLQSGGIAPNINGRKWGGPWIAKTQEGWLTHDGMGHLESVPEIDEESRRRLVNLPLDWWRFATVTDGANIVKEPEWPRDDHEKVIHGGPQILAPQSQKIA